MRIYAVADIHSRARRLDMIRERVRRLEPDVVVVAGDITRYVRPLPVLAVLNDLPVPVLAVRGNSDLPRTERLIEHLPNLRALHLRETEVRGVSFVGLSGAVPVPFHTRTAWREKTLGRRVGPMIREETVLVTHAPPYGTLDDVFERLGDLHAGSRQVRDLVLSRRPALSICGHIHETAGAARLGRTLVVNCSIGRDGGGALIEYEHGAVPRVEML